MSRLQTMTQIRIEASDVSGQKVVSVPNVPTDATVGEVIRGLLPLMDLPENDAGGHQLTYHARLEREGRHLHASELVSDALETDDRVVLQPNIDAGIDGG
jgi:hypothetical protein